MRSGRASKWKNKFVYELVENQEDMQNGFKVQFRYEE